jgi:hypothetical protein
MANPVKIAFHLPTQKFIHIDNASNGLSCQCECLKCNERLEAIQGEVRTKHFRHHINVNCEGSQESALHELGKQILVDNFQIAIQNRGTITYSNAIAEKRLEIIRPDVSATFEGQPIYFEIYVSHAVDSGKQNFFTDRKYKSVEINLSNCTTTSFEQIKKIVLEQTENQTVFYWGDEILVESKFESPVVKADNSTWIEKLIIASIVYFIFKRFYCFLFPKK